MRWTLLRELKDLGLSLSIDDFGTGYSSLAYLKRFAIDKLKIDQSFVRDIPDDLDSMEITASIIAMAKNLHLKVLAEGVEAEDQLAFLQIHNCDACQGYLFSRPLPAPELERWLAAPGGALSSHRDHPTGVEATMSDPAELPPPRLLLVDDEANILSSLRRLLRAEGYAIRTAEGGAQGLELLEQEPADVIISDMRMPGMSGAEFLKQARARWPDTVRILLTGFADVASTVSAVNEGGIHNYLSKPWDDTQLLQAVRGAVERKRLLDERDALLELTARQNQELTFLNEGLEDAVRARTAELKQSAAFLELSNRKLKESFLVTLRVFSNLIELRQKNLGGHGKRVADLARKIALRLDMREQEVNDITVAGLLHDIGKIGWPDELIGKPLSLFTPEERRLAMRHPAIAESALMELENLRGATRIIRHHHERFSGNGYPDGLAGLHIPIGARILAVANDYDGLQLGTITQRRRSPAEAVEMIREGRGMRYDPAIVDLFLEVMGKTPAVEAIGPVRRIGSAELVPGMKLAKDLVSPDGIMLLSKGYVLDALLVGQLRKLEETLGQPIELTISLESA
jgi:response regulator RpfG family c-di-GMP phosphodiesterase